MVIISEGRIFMGLFSAGRSLFGGLIVGGAFGLMGGQDIKEAVGNPEPAKVTCKQVYEKVPEKEWLTISGCVIDLSRATYFFKKDKPQELTDLYIPVFVDDENGPAKAKLSLHTTDQGLIGRFARAKAMGDKGEDTRAYLQEHASEFIIRGPVSGMIESGMTKSGAEHRKIRELDTDLDPDFMVLRHDKKPSLGGGIVMLGLGAIISLVGVFRGVRALRR